MANERKIAIRGYVSCVFACPCDGSTPQKSVLNCVRQLLQFGCYEISLGDTVGTGVASQVQSLMTYLFSNGISPKQLAGHFHDTYGQAVSNVWAAYQCGVRVFDTSVAGLGGCPFAPGAKGNVATEDVVYLFEQAGVSTGVDMAKLVSTGVWISKQLGRQNESRAGAALAIKAASTDKAVPQSKDQKSFIVWELVEDCGGVLMHRAGPNLRLTLDQPKNGNALTAPMVERLTSIVNSVAADATITRIAICGSGKFFCTGMDLSRASTTVAKSDDGKASTTQLDLLTDLFRAIDTAPQVTVACINGPAFGGGVGLALACDLRLAVQDASITLSEVKLGLVPATISPYVVRELGVAFSGEVMLTARPVLAAELHARGIVARMTDAREKLPSLLDTLLIDLKMCAPRASTLTKKLVKLNSYHGGENTEIREVFNEMMGLDAEAAFGVKQFHAGRKELDWDERGQEKYSSKL